MKSLLIIIVLLIIFPFVTLSQVMQGECYIDNDPGPGNGISFTAADGGFGGAIESILNSALSIATPGPHSVNIRVLDNNGNWGPVFKTVVDVSATLTTRPVQVTAGELFWDTDPGTGSGVALVAFDGSYNNAIESVINSSAAVPANGIHKLCVRTMDNVVWGPVFTTVVNVENSLITRNINITDAELFWDADPGAGNGVAMVAFDGNFDNAIETVLDANTSVPSLGLHKLNVRVKDAANNWGSIFSTVVNIENPFVIRNINVTAAELFWDTDPGAGSGVLMVAFDGNFNNAVEAVLNSNTSVPAAGLHILNVRVKDAANNWGEVFKTVVNVEQLFVSRNINITAGELFFDSDPGNGNGLQFVAFDGNFSDAIETVVNNSVNTLSLSTGIHKLSVRTKDTLNSWGPVFSTILNVEDTFVARNIKITEAEMFFDADPGFGGGIAMLAFDGNFNDAIETASKNWSFLPDTGLHTFSVRAKDVNGNWGPVNNSVVYITPCTSSPVPLVTLGGSNTICTGDSVLLSADSGFTTYTWMRGTIVVGTGQNYYAKLAGFYKVWVTDTGNCPGSSAYIQIIVTSLNPSVSVYGPTTFCEGGSVTLDAGTGYISYLWSTGETTQMITVDTTGTYTVNVNNGSCTVQSLPVNTTVNPLPSIPVITPGGPVEFCNGDSVSLTAGAENSYIWNTTDTSQTITVYASGSYIVTVSNANGCTAVSSATNVNVHLPAASITPAGSTNICAGDSVALTANNSTLYQWNTGEITQTVYADTAGNYIVTVTDNIGCSAVSSPVSVNVYEAPDINLNISGTTTFCQGDSVVLSISTSCSTCSYSWSTGDTTQNITVYSSGNYTGYVSSSCATASSSPVIISVLPLPAASVTPNSPVSLCPGDSVTFTASGGDSYMWNTGDTVSSITVSTPGSYFVVVSNSCGTDTSLSVPVSVHANPVAVITASGPTAFCSGGSVTLISDTANSYNWSNGSISQSIVVGSAGSFYVAITDSNGCSAISPAITVEVFNNPVPVISAQGPLTFCLGDSVILESTPAVSYSWSNGDTTQFLTVTTSGNYNVIVTDTNGCTGTSASPVSVNVLPSPVPSVAPAGPTVFCDGDSVIINCSNAVTYLWSTGDTIQSIVASQSGSYLVTVTNIAGCTGVSNTIIVTENTNPVAVITPDGPTTFCDGNAVQLQSSTANSYSWSNGSNLQNVTVITTGTFIVTITDANGCTGISSPVSVTVNALPVAVITPDGPYTFCTGDSVGLSATTANSYIWSTGSSMQSITVSSSGNYTVTVTSAEGCTNSSGALTVTVNALPVAVITPDGPITFCAGDSVGLSATTANSYIWSTGSSLQSITVNSTGNYTVTVTSAEGCTNSSGALTVTVNPLPVVPVITQSGDSLITDQGLIYQWYMNDTLMAGETNYFVFPQIDAYYSVVITDLNGCQAESAPFQYIYVEELGFDESSIEVYPNPFSDYTNIVIKVPDFTKKYECEFVLLNAIGEEIIKSEISESNNILNRGNLVPGVYLYYIRITRNNSSDSFSKHGKLVIR